MCKCILILTSVVTKMVGTIESIQDLEVCFSISWNGCWDVVALLKG
jgi:hypothetical protein